MATYDKPLHRASVAKSYVTHFLATVSTSVQQ